MESLSSTWKLTSSQILPSKNSSMDTPDSKFPRIGPKMLLARFRWRVYRDDNSQKKSNSQITKTGMPREKSPLHTTRRVVEDAGLLVRLQALSLFFTFRVTIKSLLSCLYSNSSTAILPTMVVPEAGCTRDLSMSVNVDCSKRTIIGNLVIADASAPLAIGSLNTRPTLVKLATEKTMEEITTSFVCFSNSNQFPSAC